MALEFYTMKIPVEHTERYYICMQKLNKQTKRETKVPRVQFMKLCVVQGHH